jgi:ATP-binding cassette, subfamily B, multidrug efflux pump
VSELRYLNKYLYKYKYRFILGILFIIGTHILSIIPARLVKHMFDFVKDSIKTYELLHETNTQASVYKALFEGLFFYSVLMLLAYFIKAVCSFLLRQAILITANNIEYELKNEIYHHYQTLPLSFYRHSSTGDLIARISEDVNRVKMYLGPAMVFGFNSLTLFLLLFPYMLSINVKLTLCSVGSLPFLAIATYYGSTFLHQRSEKLQTKLASLTTFVQESFSGIRVLQAFSRENDFTKDFSQACEDYKKQALSLTAINSIFGPLAIGATGLGIIMTVFVGGKEVLKGNITTGNIAEFIMYMHLVTWPVLSISIVTSFIQRAAASQKRINEFLQVQNPIVSTKNLVRPIQGSLVFKEVSFTYPDSGIQALNTISLSVPAGESIAIIGTTGSGKSTIANLLTRLYDADQGLITIDGIPIQEYAIPSLREQIGYVPQETFLFPDTLKNNIAFGKTEATDAQIIDAAKHADLYTSIQRFPQKMETMLGERGVTLSGGQKQRIAIARALLREPRILILDDSLSAVDPQTEYSILKTLEKVMQGRTTILISHRVSAARLAKQILVLDAAKVIEQGTHEKLLDAKGLYYSLYKKQKMQP